MATVSLVTCTHNPSAALFSRTVVAVASLVPPPGCDVEFVVVDNASAPPLKERLAEFPAFTRMPGARIVSEPAPGLSAARRRGVRETRGDLIVWFDDDLVPAPDYLAKALAVANANRDVEVFGAGTIDVEFTDPVPAWVDSDMRAFFQQRRHERAEFGTPHSWVSYCPFGSGLVTRRVAAQRWSDAVDRGAFTLTGRSGGKLTSGDDAQLIFSAVSAGGRIGVTPDLRLTHLIPGRRCTEAYIERMEFGLSAGLRVALAECFPGENRPADEDLVSFFETLRRTMAMARAHGLRQARFDLARQLGAMSGAVQVNKRAAPLWLGALTSMLGVGD
jgi:GT2 family glycosyltransferase